MIKQLGGTSQTDIVRQLTEAIDTELQIILTLSADLDESMAGKRAREALIWPLRLFILFWLVRD
jgi:hypothetical protein